jgi:amino acid adenylation domain-containing protein
MRPDERTIHGRFAAVARANQDGTALLGRRCSLTYQELGELARRFAARLAHAGVGAHRPVVICLNRSPEAIVAMLAVLSLGAVYVPMDPSYPATVRAAYASRVGAPVIVARRGAEQTFPGSGAVIPIDIEDLRRVDAPPDAPLRIGEDDGAYIMFTSGSVGAPKAVLIPHGGVVRLVCQTNYIELTPADSLLQLSPLTFDASTFEIWGALLNGGRLVLYEDEFFDVNAVSASLRRDGITVMWLTAALFHVVARRCPEMFSGLRVLLAGGDVLHVAAVQAVLETCKELTLINGYGPTENTTFTCCHVMTSRTSLDRSIPIGRPITGTTVHVLDEAMRPVPAGSVGELVAGGRGVALGYLDGSARSKAAFIDDPFASGGRLYKTGDLVREIAEGVYEFVGRVDNQIKVRGFRIATEEVQRALSEIHGVEDGVICVEDDHDGEKRLVAFVQSREDPEPLRRRVRDELTRRLPHFMVPDVIYVRQQLPVNINGKLDRRALSGPTART